VIPQLNRQPFFVSIPAARIILARATPPAVS